MTADLGALLSHLDAETCVLVDVLLGLDARGWVAPTPSTGWTITDQVSHLAHFDEAATSAIGGPAQFASYREEAVRLGSDLPDDVARRYRAMPHVELLAWWQVARRSMVRALQSVEPELRAPWYGPDLSVGSMLSGRIMETWAHGQDVFDAFGLPHPTTDAIFDVARLCARTRANSYASQGRPVPSHEVEVELRAPDGSTWRFGESSDDRITGDAVEFCLVATQRRHRDDTSLVASSTHAAEWLSIAQAYAGPAGTGRPAVSTTR